MATTKNKETQRWSNFLAGITDDLDARFDYIKTPYGVIPIYEEPTK